MTLNRHAYRGMAPMRRLIRLLQVESNGCLTYSGRLTAEGYAVAWLDGRSGSLHRFMYEQLVGPITDEHLDHLCSTRHCVNPAHLEPVSSAENTRRAALRRQTCANGHAYTPDNTSRLPRERCLTCSRERQARYRARQNTNTSQRSTAA